MPDLVLGFSITVVVMILLAFYVSWRASRLDRLHTRLETARAALDTALARRHSAVMELAAAAHLEPASRLLLADAAGQARRAASIADTGAEESVETAESDLSRTLRVVLEEPGAAAELRREAAGREALTELLAEGRRVHLARRVHNDAVATIREARQRLLVRTLRLAGHAPLPELVEIDDDPPQVEGQVG